MEFIEHCMLQQMHAQLNYVENLPNTFPSNETRKQPQRLQNRSKYSGNGKLYNEHTDYAMTDRFRKFITYYDEIELDDFFEAKDASLKNTPEAQQDEQDATNV